MPRFLPEADTPAHWVFLPARSFTFQRRQQLVLVHPHSSDWGRYTLLHTYPRAVGSHFYNSNCSTRVATHTTHGPWTTIAAATATALCAASIKSDEVPLEHREEDSTDGDPRDSHGHPGKIRGSGELQPHRHPPIRGGIARIRLHNACGRRDAEPADCDDDVPQDGKTPKLWEELISLGTRLLECDGCGR